MFFFSDRNKVREPPPPAIYHFSISWKRSKINFKKCQIQIRELIFSKTKIIHYIFRLIVIPGLGIVPNSQVWGLKYGCWRYQASEFGLNSSFKLRSKNILADLLKYSMLLVFFYDLIYICNTIMHWKGNTSIQRIWWHPASNLCAALDG